MTTVRASDAIGTTPARATKRGTLLDAPTGVSLLPRRTAPPQPTFQQRLASAGSARSQASASTRYEPLIQKYARQYGVDPALVRAVIQVESSWNPKAVSSAGAMGLMQLMPENVKDQKVSDPFDPEQNVRAGVEQRSWYLRQYGGATRLALAAATAGPGAVAKYGGVPPYEETQRYLRLIGDLMGTAGPPARSAGRTR